MHTYVGRRDVLYYTVSASSHSDILQAALLSSQLNLIPLFFKMLIVSYPKLFSSLYACIPTFVFPLYIVCLYASCIGTCIHLYIL